MNQETLALLLLLEVAAIEAQAEMNSYYVEPIENDLLDDIEYITHAYDNNLLGVA